MKVLLIMPDAGLLMRSSERSYDVVGNQTSRTDAEGRTTTFVYDARRQLVERITEEVVGADGSTPFRYRKMPYRVFLRLICERLQATYDEDAFAYESSQQLIDDLSMISNSLAARRGENAGQFAVKRLIRRVETFGFHFLSLDIRHNADDLQQVVGHCLEFSRRGRVDQR